MGKIVKPSVAGHLWKGVGYLVIGLTRYDVKIVKNQEKKSENSPEFKLIQYNRDNPEFQRHVCNLFAHTTHNGSEYFTGTIELGFGQMQIKIFRISEEKRKDKEKSPTSVIFGRLLMEKIESPTQSDSVPPVEEIPDEEIPF